MDDHNQNTKYINIKSNHKKDRYKREKKVLSIVVIIILILAIIVGYRIVYIINSPGYALMRIMADINNSGVDGLKAHLTGEAKEFIDRTDDISSNNILNYIMNVLDVNE